MSSQIEDVEIPAAARVFVRSAYNYDMDFASDVSGLECKDPTRTQQQYKEETDINMIVKRFGLTGEIPNDFEMPRNVDLVDAITDYHTAMNVVREAGEEFMRVPAELRARFHNDPSELMAFIEDDNNVDEARRLGLLKKPEAIPGPIEVRVIQDPGAAAGSTGGSPGAGGFGTVTT